MYIYVRNSVEASMFQSIWRTVWKEKGFELESDQEVLHQMLITNEQGHCVGTIEYKPYHLTNNPIHRVADFQDQPEMALPARVVEIDKVALLREHRGPNIARLISAMLHYADKHDKDYFVCLLEPVFARALRVSFQIPMRQISDRVAYKGDDVIPTIIDVGKVRRNKHLYSWIIADTAPSVSNNTVVV
ncbi:hypothetical protein [Paenibacillus taiwanensis]|uniref:hypothetical protein n=1 Tax=Paenibacillus taiwanensis TaxID=401638 RepID=UPI00040B71E5|nr:hypothetical protein [Paenibacillus taiwanensis]